MVRSLRVGAEVVPKPEYGFHNHSPPLATPLPPPPQKKEAGAESQPLPDLVKELCVLP